MTGYRDGTRKLEEVIADGGVSASKFRVYKELYSDCIFVVGLHVNTI